jgi:uncharacterized protein YneF (UPF0154 family)
MKQIGMAIAGCIGFGKKLSETKIKKMRRQVYESRLI